MSDRPPLPEPTSDITAVRWTSGDTPSLRREGVAQIHGLPSYTAGQMHAYADAVLADARDCRTCMNYVTCCNTYPEDQDCTNGDHYEPLPPVRLWRQA